MFLFQNSDPSCNCDEQRRVSSPLVNRQKKVAPSLKDKEEKEMVHRNSRPDQEAGSRPRDVTAVQESSRRHQQQSQGAVQAAVTGTNNPVIKQQFHTSKIFRGGT